MIQRIQSLFLLCTAIVTGLLFFMPVASIVVPNNFTYAFLYDKSGTGRKSVCIHHLELDVIDPECPYYHIA